MKKTLLFAAGLAIVSMPVAAQRLAEGYVTWPDGQSLATYINAWNGGNGTITIDGKQWEDQNFFISRVKPKVRFFNNESQVYPSLTQHTYNGTQCNFDGKDKRLAFWVPISDEKRSSVKLNAMPDGNFDGEVFTMWNYVDNYGNWNSPFGWTPGVFADVAHKNGVSVHGVAGVPFGNCSGSGWGSSFTSLTGLNHDAIGKFLYYHGQDGLGYNSEWSDYGVTGLISMHNDLRDYMKTRNPLWEVMWYGGTNDNGACSFDTGLNNNTKLYAGASLFMNYNWQGYMSSAITAAKNMNKDPFFCYAGMNIQGGEPKLGDNYNLLKDYQYSIGLWGAHQVNMYWQDRYANGSSPETKMNTYLKEIEQWFGNGPRNPAIKKTITLNRTHRPTDSWAGMSSMVSARSTLAWDIYDEPFVTYFNLGNGSYMNWKGERQNNNAWYNIGVQDYLPTWRYWFAPEFMQKDVTEGSVSLDAHFTWEDAYVGGSCLAISGSTEQEYLHLFKTNFTLDNSQVITVYYKLIDGSADVDLILSSSGSPTEADEETLDGALNIFTVANSEAVADESYTNGWQKATFELGGDFSGDDILDNGLGVIALRFSNAENMKLLLGGLTIEAEGEYSKPLKPEITLSRVLAYNNSGVDGKIIWNMANSKAKGEPCYNSDVNTSMFRMWAQQEGEEPVMMGLTTSWAGIVFGAPVNPQGSKKIRFGVSALGLDNTVESDVAWSNYLSTGEYVTVDNVKIDKSIIKPNEKFTLSFADPLHASATWTIKSSDGTVVWTGNGVSVECPGIDGIGAYNLEVAFDGKTAEYTGFVAISTEAVGALPEIYSLSIDGKDIESVGNSVDIEINAPKEFSYTGRPADGSASRSIDLNENWFGVQCDQINLQQNQSFSVAAWVKYDELPAGRSNFITIEDRIGGGWPYDNWGYFWSRINEEGKFIYDGVDTAWGWRTDGNNTEGGRIFYRYTDARVDVGAWVHVVIVFEYKSGTNQMRSRFYLNGKLQRVSEWVACQKSTFEAAVNNGKGQWSEISKVASAIGAPNGTNTYEPPYSAHNYPVTSGTWITFGGSSQDISAVKGGVDDFQVWGKAMTQEDVNLSMSGLDKNNLPADVLGFWDFETDVESDYGFVGYAGSNATKKSPKAYWYKIDSKGEGKNTRIFDRPVFLAGCPFISGTAYPVVTKPEWSTRRATVVGDGTGESGAATIQWSKAGDYTVQLKLANGHGSAVRDYPVLAVKETLAGIDDVATDGSEFSTYTVDDALFVEFGSDGNYTIDVYNMSGMLVGQKQASVVAGQNARISLGSAGVYLVKVTRDGKLLRTVKVIRK